MDRTTIYIHRFAQRAMLTLLLFHSVVWRALGHLDIRRASPSAFTLITFCSQEEEQGSASLHKMHVTKGWEIHLPEVQRPAPSPKFLKIRWSGTPSSKYTLCGPIFHLLLRRSKMSPRHPGRGKVLRTHHG